MYHCILFQGVIEPQKSLAQLLRQKQRLEQELTNLEQLEFTDDYQVRAHVDKVSMSMCLFKLITGSRLG